MKTWKRWAEWGRLNITTFSSTAPKLLSQLLLHSPALSFNSSSPSGPSNHQSTQSHTDKNPHPQWLSTKWLLLSTELATEALFAASANISNYKQSKVAFENILNSQCQQFLLYSDLCSWSTTSFATNTFWNSSSRVDLITDWPFLFNKLPCSDPQQQCDSTSPCWAAPEAQGRCHRQQVHTQCLNSLLLLKARPLRAWLENTHPSPSVLVLPSASQKAQLQNCWS